MKPNISAIMCLISLLLLVEEATSSIYRHNNRKLWKLRSKLEEKRASDFSPDLYSPLPALNNIKRVGRVFYPIGYGADSSGKEDSSNAIIKAMEEAYDEVQNGSELLPGINGLGGVVIDLLGGNYKNQPTH